MSIPRIRSLATAIVHGSAKQGCRAGGLREFVTSTTNHAASNRGQDPLQQVYGGTGSRNNAGNSQYTDFASLISSPMPQVDTQALLSTRPPQPHRLHALFTKHNTHLTFTAPVKPSSDIDEYTPLPSNKPLLVFSTGTLGFRKAGRGTYDAAYQLASYTLKQIQERGHMRDVRQVEVVLRGFGPGREAVMKAMLGQEGRLIRPKIVKLTDATRLKFGGARSPKPRRLG